MRAYLVIVIAISLAVAGCSRRKPPVAQPAPPPAAGPPATAAAPPPPPVRVEEALPVPPEPVGEDSIGGRSLDELNRNSPFKPVFFDLDSAELDDRQRAVVSGNADLLKKYSAWVITVEGHADERGTAEYNLALGERRAVAVKTYLISLGVAPDRVRTVSYGKEFPFDPGHNEAAWSKNRRAHFVITSK
jgi:peptidoglycan-associated lipoprotein